MTIGTIVGTNMVGAGMVMRMLPFILNDFTPPNWMGPISAILMILGFFVIVFSVTGIFNIMLGKRK